MAELQTPLGVQPDPKQREESTNASAQSTPGKTERKTYIMAGAPNLKELLAQPTDKFVRPPALPEGWWKGTIKAHSIGVSTKKKTPFVEFIYTVTAPGDDISSEDLEGLDLGAGKEVRQQFYITPSALYRLSEHLNAVLGEEPGIAFDERLPNTTGIDILVQLSKRQSDTSDDEYNDVRKVMKAD